MHSSRCPQFMFGQFSVSWMLTHSNAHTRAHTHLRTVWATPCQWLREGNLIGGGLHKRFPKENRFITSPRITFGLHHTVGWSRALCTDSRLCDIHPPTPLHKVCVTHACASEGENTSVLVPLWWCLVTGFLPHGGSDFFIGACCSIISPEEWLS